MATVAAPAPPKEWKPLSCNATADGFRVLVLNITAKDKPGLLAAVCRRITEIGPHLNIDAGSMERLSDYTRLTLILRSVEQTRSDVRGFAEPLQAFSMPAEDAGETPCMPYRLKIHGPDRPGVLNAALQCLERLHIDVRTLGIDAVAEIPKGTDLLAGSEPIDAKPVCTLKMRLLFSMKSPLFTEVETDLQGVLGGEFGVQIIPPTRK